MHAHDQLVILLYYNQYYTYTWRMCYLCNSIYIAIITARHKFRCFDVPTTVVLIITCSHNRICKSVVQIVKKCADEKYCYNYIGYLI